MQSASSKEAVAAEVCERPILFSGAMVRAILAGTKSATRRVVKPAPPAWVETFGVSIFTPNGRVSGRGVHPEHGASESFFRCPYGQRGDRLWVRETWSPDHANVYPCYPLVYRASAGLSDSDIGEHATGCTFESSGLKHSECLHCADFRWRPSIFMPRWASRLTLEVTEVRVQRVQEISEEDARAEGARFTDYGKRVHNLSADGGRTYHKTYSQKDGWSMAGAASSDQCLSTARTAFANLWDSINGSRPGCSWSANPWVWCVSFKRVEARP